jgi:hypothetical protein
LWVADTGWGIPIDQQERIFEPFASTYSHRRPKGVGLGLTITRHLVALHQGLLTLESQPGVGSSLCQEGISIVKTNGFTVSNNRVHDAKQGAGTNPGGGEGIDAKEGSKNGIIAYNNVYNLVQLGIDVDAWDQLTENIQIYGNHVYNTAAGIVVGAENSGTVRNVKIRDNIIYNTGYHGIELSNAGTNGRRENIRIYNNTVVRNGFTAYKPPWCSLYGCAD